MPQLFLPCVHDRTVFQRAMAEAGLAVALVLDVCIVRK